jgi:hypothetical protein
MRKNKKLPLSERVAQGKITPRRANAALDIQEREQKLASQKRLALVCLVGLVSIAILMTLLIIGGVLEFESGKELLIPITDFFIRQLSDSSK